MDKVDKKKNWSKKKIVIVSVLCSVGLYILVCFIITGSQCLHMLFQSKNARNVVLGETRWNEVKDLPNAKVKLYSERERKNDPNLDVVDLYYFPSKSNNKSDYALILPGGGYFECNVNKVAFPLAATLNESDINCFVLGYRYGKYSSYLAPLYDVVNAVKYISNNASIYNVNIDDYMVVGFSAGGHLASYFASPYGFRQFGLKDPKVVSLIYPWTNACEGVNFNGNIFKLGIDLFLNSYGPKKFLGDKRNDATERKKMNSNSSYTKEHIDSINTKFYVIHGAKDVLVDKRKNSDVFVKQLENLGLSKKNETNFTSFDRLVYREVSDANHGFGLGINTKASGWSDDVIKLWSPHK